MHSSRFALAAVSLLTLGASLSHAVIAPNLTSITPTTGGFTWTYEAVAQPNSLVAAGDYFTIYDFQGYAPPDAITQPGGWVSVPLLLTPAPANTNPPDSPAVYNVTFQYQGLTTAGDLGAFSIFSPYGHIDSFPGIYAGQDHNETGAIITYIATTDTPAVPEPASLSAVAIAALPLLRRRR